MALLNFMCFFFVCIIYVNGDEPPCPFTGCTCKDAIISDEFTFYPTVKCRDMPTFDKTDKKYKIGYLIMIGDVYQISANHFEAFTSITFLSLTQSPAKTLNWEAGAFDGVEIDGLEVNGLLGDIIRSSALIKLGPKLSSLSIINGQTPIILTDREKIFQTFSSLRELSIMATTVKITGNVFVGLVKLVSLIIRHAGLTVIPDVSQTLQGLKNLDLSNNDLRITQLPPAWQNWGLETLNLENNPVLVPATIPTDALDNLPISLKRLNLNNVGLNGEVPSQIIKSGLVELKLSSNRITTISATTFTPGTSLTKIDLSDNPITDDGFKIGAFDHVKGGMGSYLKIGGGTKLNSIDISGLAKFEILDLDESKELESIMVVDLDKYPTNVFFKISATACPKLITIDSKIGDLMGHRPQAVVDISNNVHLVCVDLVGLAPYALCDRKQIAIDGVKCTDKDNTPLEEYLKTIEVGARGCAVTPTPGPTEGPTKKNGATPTFNANSLVYVLAGAYGYIFF